MSPNATEMLEEFLLDGAARQLSPATLGFYERTVRAFLDWLGARPLTAATVRDYMLHKASTANAGGLHAIGRGLRAWLRWCYREGLLQEPVPVPMPRQHDPHRPCPSQDEVRRWLRGAKSARDKALALVAIDTGLRISELAALQWQDVDGDSVVVRHSKNGRGRTVFLGYSARRAILRLQRREMLDRSNLVFGCTPGGLRWAFRRISQRSGVSISPHMLRRYFCVQSLTNGLDVLSLQRLLGHRSVAMVSIYAQLATADLQAIYHRQPSPADRL